MKNVIIKMGILLSLFGNLWAMQPEVTSLKETWQNEILNCATLIKRLEACQVKRDVNMAHLCPVCKKYNNLPEDLIKLRRDLNWWAKNDPDKSRNT